MAKRIAEGQMFRSTNHFDVKSGRRQRCRVVQQRKYDRMTGLEDEETGERFMLRNHRGTELPYMELIEEGSE